MGPIARQQGRWAGNGVEGVSSRYADADGVQELRESYLPER